MTHIFKLSRRIARLRAPLAAAIIFGFGACNPTDSFTPESSIPPTASDPGASSGVQGSPVSDPSFATVSFAGGIPMGVFHLPNSYLDSRYNGAMHTVSPTSLLSDLAAVKARGGKVAVDFSGNEKYYKDANGNFSLSMWKQRVGRFRGVNFSSYVKDGTIIAHYIIDEPNYAAKWGGRAISPSTVEQMAAYSKQLWPGLPTVARVDADYLLYNHVYLDAAWAQYVYRKGTASDYIKRNVSAAQARGLALITGMNILRGGPNGAKMTPTQVRDWGSTLLGSSYPCAFITWKWDDTYMTTSAMKDAMTVLRNKAQNRSLKTCRS